MFDPLDQTQEKAPYFTQVHSAAQLKEWVQAGLDECYHRNVRYPEVYQALIIPRMDIKAKKQVVAWIKKREIYVKTENIPHTKND